MLELARVMTSRRISFFAPLIRARFDLAWTCKCVSRMLLLLVVIEAVTMPLTQYLWTWDHFLRGGLDFETSALVIVTFLCFALLRAQGSRHNLESQFAMEISSPMIAQQQGCCGSLRARRLSADLREDISASPSALCNLPLLI